MRLFQRKPSFFLLTTRNCETVKLDRWALLEAGGGHFLQVFYVEIRADFFLGPDRDIRWRPPAIGPRRPGHPRAFRRPPTRAMLLLVTLHLPESLTHKKSSHQDFLFRVDPRFNLNLICSKRFQGDNFTFFKESSLTNMIPIEQKLVSELEGGRNRFTLPK